MKRIIEDYIVKTFGEHVLSDLKLTVGEKVNVFEMFNPKTAVHPKSEMNHRKARMIDKVLKRNDQIKDESDEAILTHAAPVIFINGIITPRYVAEHQASVLEQSLGKAVRLVYNKTDGLVSDLVECSDGRHGILTKPVIDAMRAINACLKHHPKLLIVAYSQGAIIATLALQTLARQWQNDEITRIHLATFGAGFKSCELPEEILVEHFANLRDPIPQLGLLHPEYPFSGTLFTRDARGHFFVADYILPMSEGQTFGDSEFEKQVIQPLVDEPQIELE